MELLLAVLLLCLLVYAVGTAVKFLKKHGKTVLLGAAAILAILIGIKLLPLLGTGGTVILICAGAACCTAVIVFAIHYFVGGGAYLQWLDRAGIGSLEEAPGRQNAHDRAVQQGRVEMLDNVYVMSTKFHEKLLCGIDQHRVLKEEKFLKCCRSAAPKFRAEYAGVLLEHLCDENLLLKLGSQETYISQKMVKDCEQILNQEGAATEAEFAEICGKSGVAPDLHDAHDLLAKTVLTNMVRTGKADKVSHNENGAGDLYVSKNPAPNCRMTKREITLDD